MTTKAIFDSDGNLIATGRNAGSGETLRNVDNSQVDAEAYPGYGHWDATNNKIAAGNAQIAVAPTEAQIDAYTNGVIDLVNISWIWNMNGTLTENNRWKNWFLWVGSAHFVCKEIIGSATHTAEQKVSIFESYKSLIPQDAPFLAFWYRNHSQPVWDAYRAQLTTNVQNIRAHYAGVLSGNIPARATDAASALAWTGTGTTLNVGVPIVWRG